MPKYEDFDRLECLTRIVGTLVNKTPLRVGSGGEPPVGSAVDIAVFRVKEKPCIPGSSLKGMLRSVAEMHAKAEGWKVHPPWEQEPDGERCEICGIFGDQKLASHVQIYDVFPEETARIFVKPGVAINRDFGSVEHVFHEEFVEPGTRWKFQMDILNIQVFPSPGDNRGRLLHTLFQMLRNPGLQVGARKTIGAGLIVLSEATWELYKLEDGQLKLKERGPLS